MLRFALLVALAVLLATPGCDREPAPSALVQSPHAVTLPQEAFSIGSPEQFRKPGIYQNFRRSHGVWVVSRSSASGPMIVVLSAATPGFNSGTLFDQRTQRFRCPVSGSRFTTDGLLSGSDGRARRSLPRLRVDLVKGELLVRPDRLFFHEDNDWSNPYSMHIVDSETHPDRSEPGPENPFAPVLRPTHDLGLNQ